MKKWLNIIVVSISLATIASGLFQAVAPTIVMNVISAEINPTAVHFFRIVGMFMFLFGGLLIHAVYSVTPQKPAILWAAFQKLGAFAAVSLGVFTGIFSVLAMGVALFDLFSGALFLYYYKKAT
ncbi:patatin [Fulvivirga sp. RKSG066]|uniref:patatin n=1 Tax=Fulvivirga aurantia TaxID=2529383 RepID=UPI0012BB6F14|nr:patatin [Fulvivirga aurantia]MTI23156.1 patatin [Fulvivirga aurantia]